MTRLWSAHTHLGCSVASTRLPAGLNRERFEAPALSRRAGGGVNHGVGWGAAESDQVLLDLLKTWT